MMLMPAIDLIDGRVVRLRQGDFGVETRYPDAPEALARRYVADGARGLHVVDLDAARTGRFANLGVVARIAASVDVPVQAGGGVRSEADLERLLSAGVARAIVGSAAVREPGRVLEWIARHGTARCGVAIDVRLGVDGDYEPAVAGWTEGSAMPLDALVGRYADAAPGLVVLCTDIARDGMMAGPNLALYARLCAAAPGLAWIASGGVRDRADVAALRAVGVAGAVVGRAVLEDPARLPEMLAC